ncbi:unnamed protein product [Polarella glacialis]|nr:unnamed protein product [Polarella glacialis]
MSSEMNQASAEEAKGSEALVAENRRSGAKAAAETEATETTGDSGSGKAGQTVLSVLKAAPWMVPLKAALNHGGTKRPKRDRQEAKRKQVQLATVDTATGRPAVRTVSFRGFLAPYQLEGASHPVGRDVDGAAAPQMFQEASESCCLLFVTDDRAQKVRHISESAPHSFVEVNWWLDEASVQFRIAGSAVLASANSSDPHLRAVRTSVWARLKVDTRGTFTWPTPGLPRGGPDESTADCTNDTSDAEDAQKASSDISAGPQIEDAHFAVVIVVPDRVDELRLGGNQRRRIYTLLSSSLDEEHGMETLSARDLDPDGTAHPTKAPDLPQLPFKDLFRQTQRANWSVEEVNP